MDLLHRTPNSVSLQRNPPSRAVKLTTMATSSCAPQSAAAASPTLSCSLEIVEPSRPASTSKSTCRPSGRAAVLQVPSRHCTPGSCHCSVTAADWQNWQNSSLVPQAVYLGITGGRRINLVTIFSVSPFSSILIIFKNKNRSEKLTLPRFKIYPQILTIKSAKRSCFPGNPP